MNRWETFLTTVSERKLFLAIPAFMGVLFILLSVFGGPDIKNLLNFLTK